MSPSGPRRGADSTAPPISSVRCPTRQRLRAALEQRHQVHRRAVGGFDRELGGRRTRTHRIAVRLPSASERQDGLARMFDLGRGHIVRRQLTADHPPADGTGPDPALDRPHGDVVRRSHAFSLDPAESTTAAAAPHRRSTAPTGRPASGTLQSRDPAPASAARRPGATRLLPPRTPWT